MNPRFILRLVLVLSVALIGCSTAKQAATNRQINDFPYQTKPHLLKTGQHFYWFFAQDKKTIGYEPCIGTYGVDLLKESKQELIFKITESVGVPLDLLDGRRTAKSEVVGKQFRAKINGNQIIAVSEIK